MVPNVARVPRMMLGGVPALDDHLARWTKEILGRQRTRLWFLDTAHGSLNVTSGDEEHCWEACAATTRAARPRRGSPTTGGEEGHGAGRGRGRRALFSEVVNGRNGRAHFVDVTAQRNAEDLSLSVDVDDVAVISSMSALEALYKSLNSPTQLIRDVSCNSIGGEISHSLPPNATYIDLTVNNFNSSIPHPIPSLKVLSYLNVSHNSLTGPTESAFTNMQDLEQLSWSHCSEKSQFCAMARTSGVEVAISGGFARSDELTHLKAPLELRLPESHSSFSNNSLSIHSSSFNVQHLTPLASSHQTQASTSHISGGFARSNELARIPGPPELRLSEKSFFIFKQQQLANA
ncbi:uncharacterized protein A4U43_C04F7910 [Asparagus officinalis]|uniref:Leucine-rich repeat-containing N-terminal plant-type domain-containing protein n=1 Tax=Asparagus officinalis TaxID=4686 RepID=A0A5P1EZ34_ASPOF|nr:uncharacterized protein A4U43_C04F7910 [Asparagus officinalis]